MTTSILCATSGFAAIPKDAVTSQPSDIRLRVLIGDVRADRVFTATGKGLFLGSSDNHGTDSIHCEFNSGLVSALLWKNPMLESGYWYCKSNSQAAKITNGVYLHSHNNIITVGDESFRGHFELVPTKDSLHIVNHIPLDAYLASLANSEISSSFPEEALKAQIIAARSYALSTALERRKKLWPFDLYNTQADQVYRGVRFETAKSLRLAQVTNRQILNFDGSVLKAFYHSSSGGHSELPLNVWGKERAKETGAYRAKPNPYDQNLSGGTWQIVLSRDLGRQIKATGAFREIKVLERTEGRRVKRLEITGDHGKTYLTGVQFRNLFGTGWLKSALFDVKKQGSSFLIQGKGWGHGVGMSQWGAKVMADSGKSAEQILKFYYPNAHVSVYGRSRSSPSVPPAGVPATISAR